MGTEPPRRDRWRARPILGGGLRLAILAVPAAVSFAVTLVMRSPSSGWRLISSHSRESSLPGLFSVRARTDSFPMSCKSAAHRRRSRSSSGSRSSSASMSV